MKWDRFTVMSQEAFQQAQSKAEELGNQELKPEHLLWAFLNQDENIVNSLLAKLGIKSQVFRHSGLGICIPYTWQHHSV